MATSHVAVRTASLGWLAAALSIGCIEIRDSDAEASTPKESAVSDSASRRAETKWLDTVDVSVPSYAAYSLDTAGIGARMAGATGADSLALEATDTTRITPIRRFPARIAGRGSVPLQLQILLDRANFSPGIIDGEWGNNASRALAFYKAASSASDPASDDPARVTTLDRATYDRLRSAAGQEPLLTKYTVSAQDLSGPFVEIPDSVYEQAKLRCLCYTNPVEAIAERYHTSRKLLAQLNPGIDLDRLTAGVTLAVPNVDLPTTAASPMDTVEIARLVISKKGFWTQALDRSGRVVLHFPSTLGAGYDPSPSGAFRITGVARNPAFHYQPKLFAEVPDSRPEARLPPGPNSPVGVVWIALSKPHYGIHGTPSPETIGYASSHGCVRLTNWDALLLSDMVENGTPVEFR